jgi:chromosome segregation ATPase
MSEQEKKDIEAYKVEFTNYWLIENGEEPPLSHTGNYSCCREFVEVDEVFKDAFVAGLKHARSEQATLIAENLELNSRLDKLSDSTTSCSRKLEGYMSKVEDKNALIAEKDALISRMKTEYKEDMVKKDKHIAFLESECKRLHEPTREFWNNERLEEVKELKRLLQEALKHVKDPWPAARSEWLDKNKPSLEALGITL